MGTRRKSREAALQFLFQDDFTLDNSGIDVEFTERFEQFCVLYQVNKKSRPYMRTILDGIIKHQVAIDEQISASAKNWRLERLAATDRSLLRLAVFEMMFSDDVPAQVAINEAVEIAKRFASDESPSFVNGILDAVNKKIDSNSKAS